MSQVKRENCQGRKFALSRGLFFGVFVIFGLLERISLEAYQKLEEIVKDVI